MDTSFNNDLQVIRTRDGSATLFVPHLNERYHSLHGAVTESLHVYINAGLRHLAAQSLPEIRILEIGFGTGLNAWLTAIAALSLPSAVHYSAIERHPLSLQAIDSVSYTEYYQHDQGKAIWSALHEAAWQKPVTIHPNFTLLKWNGDWQVESPPTTEGFHIVYYDAFAPNKQPDMWTQPLLDRCYQSLTNRGVLVTYTSKGDVRRGLLAAGFDVEKIPGPPGKRDMLRATKPTPPPYTCL